MQDVRPMERLTGSIWYGPPRVDPGVLPFIPEFWASVLLGDKTPERVSGIGTPKRSAQEDTVGMDMRSPPAAGTFDARAAYECRVAKMDSDMRGGSSGESWIQDPRSGIWTMVGLSMGEAKSGPREDMEMRGVRSHSPGNGSGGSTRLGGVIALDVGDVVRIEGVRDVKKTPVRRKSRQLGQLQPRVGRFRRGNHG